MGNDRVTKKEIRESVLNQRGLTTFKEQGKQRVFRPTPKTTVPKKLKTPLMLYFEVKHGEPIEQILLSGSLSYVVKKLDGEIDPSTVSKWIKRLKLRYTEDNLPNCEGCGRHGPACDGGVCYILLELERYDLIILKKQEILNELEGIVADGIPTQEN